MIRVVLVGALGKMGKEFFVQAENFDDIKIVAGIDLIPCDGCYPFPIYKSIFDCGNEADVVVDFSSAKSIDDVIKYCESKRINLAVFSTGHTAENMHCLKKMSKNVAVLVAPNTSLGAMLQKNIVRALTKKLPNSEIEIIESHNFAKKDIPSGTALELFENIFLEDDKRRLVINREKAKENKKEVGVHSLRYGNNICEHEVIFSFGGETIKICHSIIGRSVFANNALLSVRFLKNKKNGFFNISHLLGDKDD